MQTTRLFERDSARPELATDRVVEASRWVVNGEGVASRMRDGITTRVTAGILWRTYRALPDETFAEGFEPAETDAVSGRITGWVPVDPASDLDGLFARAPVPTDDGTYEFCGPRIGGNYEGLRGEFRYFRHGDEVLADVPRTFAGLREWFDAQQVEGVVWRHSDGRLATARRLEFALSWPPAPGWRAD